MRKPNRFCPPSSPPDSALRTLHRRYLTRMKQAEAGGDEEAAERFERLLHMVSGLIGWRLHQRSAEESLQRAGDGVTCRDHF